MISCFIPIVVLVDTSGERTEVLKALYDLQYAIQDDIELREQSDICVIFYGDTVHAEEFIRGVDFMPFDFFQTADSACLNQGLHEALKLLALRKKMYRTEGVNYCCPRLLVLSTGLISDINFKNEICKEVREAINDRKIQYVPLMVGNQYDYRVLQEYYPPGNEEKDVLTAEYDNIRKVFEETRVDGDKVISFYDGRCFKGLKNKSYLLEELIKYGGTYSTYSVQDNCNIMAKIITKDDNYYRNKLERKIRVMLSLNGIPVLEWPLDILYQDGVLMGFIVPNVQRDTIALSDILRYTGLVHNDQSTEKVLKIYPQFTWKYSVQIAYNLASFVDYLHSLGIIVGTLEEYYLYVHIKTGRIIYTECERLGVKDHVSGEEFPCELSRLDLTAPEQFQLKGLKIASQSTDLFSLSIQIFRLLMKNIHPFTGKPKDDIDKYSYLGIEARNIVR